MGRRIYQKKTVCCMQLQLMLELLEFVFELSVHEVKLKILILCSLEMVGQQRERRWEGRNRKLNVDKRKFIMTCR